MTAQEKQEIVNAVLSAIRTNSRTISQLTAISSPSDSDSIELSGGKRITFGAFKRCVAESVSVATNAMKGYRAIDATSDLPADPTPAEREVGYILGTTLYLYVGTGGDTLGGKWQSADLKGGKGDKGESGVHLGDVALVNDLTTGGEESALTAEMGKRSEERRVG